MDKKLSFDRSDRMSSPNSLLLACFATCCATMVGASIHCTSFNKAVADFLIVDSGYIPGLMLEYLPIPGRLNNEPEHLNQSRYLKTHLQLMALVKELPMHKAKLPDSFLQVLMNRLHS